MNEKSIGNKITFKNSSNYIIFKFCYACNKKVILRKNKTYIRIIFALIDIEILCS